VELPLLAKAMERHARNVHCASRRSGDAQAGTDLSYRLLLRDPERVDELLLELRQFDGVSRLTSLKAEQESEL